MLDKLKIKDYFTEVFISSKEGISKPNRLIFEKALFALGVTPGESIFVGDNAKIDIPGAKEIGMKTFLLTDNQNIINILPFV
jgi:HAD superfamily hydrolase (TIGR01549 family)